MLSVKQGSCENQFYSHWFDPTQNQTRVHSSLGGRSYHSAIWALTRKRFIDFWFNFFQPSDDRFLRETQGSG